MNSGKTMNTYEQFVELLFNSDAEQYVFFKGKESKTLCTVESVNEELKKLNNQIKELEKENKALKEQLNMLVKDDEEQQKQ